MAKVKAICEEKIRPLIEGAGYELLEVSYQKCNDGMNLIFTIDNDEGITIEDCEKVSRLIEPALDEINPTGEAGYILSVSSPGIDRPLKNERDFKRNLNKEIEVSLFQKLDGKKNFVGILKSFDEAEIEIESNGKSLKLNREKIAHIVPVIKF